MKTLKLWSSNAATKMMLDESLSAYIGPSRERSLANAVGLWAVRTLGGDRASKFADDVVAAVQRERRG